MKHVIVQEKNVIFGWNSTLAEMRHWAEYVGVQTTDQTIWYE